MKKILGLNILRVMREAEKVVEAAAGGARAVGRGHPPAATRPRRRRNRRGPIEITLQRTGASAPVPNTRSRFAMTAP